MVGLRATVRLLPCDLGTRATSFVRMAKCSYNLWCYVPGIFSFRTESFLLHLKGKMQAVLSTSIFQVLKGIF